MAPSKKRNTRTFKVGRDAGDGKFIPVAKAKAMGNRAVVETVKVTTKPSK